MSVACLLMCMVANGNEREKHVARESTPGLGSTTLSLVVVVVLVAARVHDVLDDDGPDQAVEHEEEHDEQADGHARGHPAHRLVLDLVGDGDGGQDEARVGEHHGPPAEVEVLGRARDDGDAGDEEPPEGQGPQEDGRHHGHGAESDDVDDAVHAVVETVGKAVGHADEGQRRESGRADTHEQTGTVLAVGKA